MLRLSRALRARCPYSILGVAESASTEDIKRAFQERAKITHPDVVKGKDKHFREMVDAYRILRDPRKRAEHDRNAARQRGEPDFPSDGWPRGEGEGLSEAARAKIFNYPMGGRGGRYARGAQAGARPVQEEGLDAFARSFFPLACLGCFFAYKLYQANDETRYREQDPYASRFPATARTKDAAAKDPKAADSPEARSADDKVLPGAPNLLSATESVEDQDKMVWAYYNPFTAVWHRLPDGFEPPASMDLTAWHKKHIESAEWSRLFAEGKLAEIIPRGGLKVRYIPMWETREPILVKDPITKKTVHFSENLLRSRSQAQAQTCEVRF